MVVGQKVPLGRVHAHRTVTIGVSETTLAVELDDAGTRIVRRTTTLAISNIKANRPWMTPGRVHLDCSSGAAASTGPPTSSACGT
jgi:hypothetical protein